MKDPFLAKVASMEHAAAIVTLIERPQNICYIEAEYDVTHLFLENDTRFTINAEISDLRDFLPDNLFFQCGQFNMVNADKVLEMWVSTEPILVMSCGHILPVPKYEVIKIRRFLKNTRGEKVVRRPRKVNAIH